MGQYDSQSPVTVSRTAAGLYRYAFHNRDAVDLADLLEHIEKDYKAGQLEPGKAKELFRRELRLFVPESAVR